MPQIILPFRAEYFKNSIKIKCKNVECRQRFEKNDLRLALVVQSSSLTKNVTFRWYHFECFFDTYRPECVGDIDYFECLRWDDQEKIKKKVKELNLTSIFSRGRANQRNVQNGETSMNWGFQIEYCEDQRTKCKECKQHIGKGKIRVFGTIYGRKTSTCYHLDCFMEICEEFGFLNSGETLMEGIERLTDSDQSRVRDALAEKLKKAAMYTDIRNALPKIELNDEELEVKKLHNKRMYECRDQLEKSHSTNTYVKLLKKNDQYLEFYSDNINSVSIRSCKAEDFSSQMLDRLADAMTFGALKRCPTCKKGQLEFRLGLSGMSYYCTHEDKWSRCGSYFDEPPRRAFVVPKEMKEDKHDIRMRLFWEKYDQVKIEKRVFERNPPSPLTIALNRGHQPKYTLDEIDFSSLENHFMLTQFPNAAKKEVYCDENGNIYSASLMLTDLQAEKNSYCSIQVLQLNNATGSCRWYSFSHSWGEIGMPDSSNVEYFANEKDAILTFETVFEKQTGNSWANRRSFKKVPGKKVFLDLFYGQDIAEDDETSKEPFPILEKSVQELVKLIFGRTLMTDSARKTELDDLKKMPLGKLRIKQIRQAYKVLKKLKDHVSKRKNGADRKLVVALSNKFYTLIPHYFSVVHSCSSLLLDTVPAIKEKLELLDSLMEMAIAYSPPSEECVIGLRYKELKTNLRPIDTTKHVFKILKYCVQKTYADTHDNFTMDIVRIFEVERQGEEARNEQFKTLTNKRLLWHGSARNNFPKILSEGLRINPSTAQSTNGHMFGKGIYFSDMVSKAANYCTAYKHSDNVGLLLLCEVTLGHVKHLFEADTNLKKPPGGFNSVKGVGLIEPNPQETLTLYEDVKLASGRGIPSSCYPEVPCKSRLMYNEYIVYNVAQVKLKYLLQVQINYL